MRNFPKYIVTQKAENSLKGGHPWVYDTEIISSPETVPENGSIVDIYSKKDRYLGSGFLSQKSKIRIRKISDNANDTFDEKFWERRIKYAWEYRKSVMKSPEDLLCCRVIFGEADSFPGLTVDRFNDLLSVQILSIGMEKIKDIILPAIYKVLTEDGQKISGIFEREDVAIRNLEGLEQFKGFYSLEKINVPTPKSAITEIVENGIKYIVDVENGQKTGFFLDQKYNRKAVADISKGKTVLDCFTHTGSFGLNAAMSGALSVDSVDISKTAIEQAKENARLNNLDSKVNYICENVFDLLTNLEADKSNKGKYDLVILDPPAFTKSRKTVKSAQSGYKEINYRAMKLLNRGGYLATCSCSHFMEDYLFVKMLKSAAHDAGVSLRQIEQRQQSPDHPILWNVPETDYLKFYIFQVV